MADKVLGCCIYCGGIVALVEERGRTDLPPGPQWAMYGGMKFHCDARIGATTSTQEALHMADPPPNLTRTAVEAWLEQEVV